MKLTTVFKHFDHTDSLDEKIKEKSNHLKKYLGRHDAIKWTCSTKDGSHYALAHISGPHFNLVANAQCDNLYKALDMIISKLTRQLEKKFGGWKMHSASFGHHHHHNHAHV